MTGLLKDTEKVIFNEERKVCRELPPPPPETYHSGLSVPTLPSTTQELPPPRPLGRNLEVCDYPQLPPLPTTEEVMTGLREVTIQYINHPDPIESAARRQRVHESDARGDMEEAATRIVATARTTTAATLPLTTILPSEATILLGDSHTSEQTAQPKRRGRPPAGKKKQSPAPRNLAGVCSKKMNLALACASPGRTTGPSTRPTAATQSETPVRTNSSSEATAANPRVSSSTPDFHDPEPPLP